ncbi:MAG: hypothetical protein IT181_13200 [Acidobacteria bacterium]|nr:hypothetical protein [Acidobacteriota bacterium]
MSDRSRALSQAEAANNDERPRLPGLRYALVGRPLEVFFPAANTRLDIAHGLQAVPDGYHVLLTTSAVVADNPAGWTDLIAGLQASAANARAVVVFFTLIENEVLRA